MLQSVKGRRQLRQVLKRRGGFALIIVLGFGMIIGIMSIAMIEQSILTLRLSNNKIESSKAHYAAEAGLELARLALKNANPNDNLINQTTQIQANPRIDVTWSVYNKTSLAPDGSYYIPSPSIGDAGQNCKSYQTYDVNHACNWNKVGVGQTVNVPLFYYDNFGNPVNPYGSGLSVIKIKFRTPCLNGNSNPDCNAGAGPGSRYLFNQPNQNVAVNDTIVHWEVIGNDSVAPGVVHVLQPVVDVVGNNRRGCIDTELYELLIDKVYNNFNDALVCEMGEQYKILSQARDGRDANSGDVGTIMSFLGNNTWQGGGFYTVTEPVLKMAVVHSMEVNVAYVDPYGVSVEAGRVIPYLEYQIVTDQPISNSKQLIYARGRSGNFVQEINLQKEQSGAISGFVIQN